MEGVGGVCVAGVLGDEGEGVGAGGGVDVFDVDEVAGGGVGVALGGDVEFVVGAEAAHGGPGGEGVVFRGVGGECAVESEAESDGSG